MVRTPTRALAVSRGRYGSDFPLTPLYLRYRLQEYLQSFFSSIISLCLDNDALFKYDHCMSHHHSLLCCRKRL